jgi:hypothetical protein
MTLAEMIAAHPEWDDLPRDETSARLIADALNVEYPRTQVISYEGGIGEIMRSLGPSDGAAFLDALTASTEPSIRWAMKLIEAGRLDFGDSIVRSKIDVVAPTFANELKAIAEAPLAYTFAEVEAARNG